MSTRTLSQSSTRTLAQIYNKTPTRVLVYIVSTELFTITDGTTRWGVITDINGETYTITILNARDGSPIGGDVRVPLSNILSTRPFREVKISTIYQMKDASLIFYPSVLQAPATSTISSKVTASSFCIRNTMDNPLDSTSRMSLGAGIYGTYFAEPPPSLRNRVYAIDVSTYRCYPIQDKEHGESITTASTYTNRYLDSLIVGYRNSENVEITLDSEEVSKLYTLWEIVLVRTNDMLPYEQLQMLLSQYLQDFFSRAPLLSTRDRLELVVLPINYIMKYLGYQGLVADDFDNNNDERKCVLYDYDIETVILEGSYSDY